MARGRGGHHRRRPRARHRALARADAVVLLAAKGDASDSGRLQTPCGVPLLPAVLEPVFGERLAGARLLAFAGIGRPEKFFVTLRALGADLVGARAFPDHHPFRVSELEALRNDALELLMSYSWPGNVREFRNVMERALILARGEWIETIHLPVAFAALHVD